MAVWLEEQGRAVPMPRDPQGWAALTTTEAPPGTRYRYQIDGAFLVPDPASRFQPDGVHGPSEVVDPLAHSWSDAEWTGIAIERLVFYELHVGTFTRAGTFAAAAERLDHLAALGVTAVELMPVGEFPGRRGWGYDGVLPFAPAARYGRPDDLKRFVDAAHARGLAVFLDVVYNHFGPEGNYLPHYAPAFFDPHRRTPWGAALNFDGAGSEIVRAFMVHNALYWLEEFHMDGLRLDAVQAISDESRSHVLAELAQVVAEGPGGERHVHLVLENERNEAHLLARDGAPLFSAQWNDDVHHALHALLTGERGGYYADYEPAAPALGRALTEGFVYQGEYSRYRGRPRGEPSGDLPPTAFVGFLQNHDQVGNRAFGERITVLAGPDAVQGGHGRALPRSAASLAVHGPGMGRPRALPLLQRPRGRTSARPSRRAGGASSPASPSSPTRDARGRIPDPQAPETWERSVLDWSLADQPAHREWLDFHRALLRIRHDEIVPLLEHPVAPRARWRRVGETALEVEWTFPLRRVLRLVANLGPAAVPHAGPRPEWGRSLYALELGRDGWAELPPWSVGWYLAEAER